MPPLPPWEGMHPLLVHLPIGLMMVAPVPALLALLRPHCQVYRVLTFFVVLFATVGSLLATMSGEAAEHLLRDRGLETAAVHDTLEEHAELGETTRTVSVILTLVFAGIVIGGTKGKLRSATAGRVAGLVVLVGTLVAVTLVANTAHYGATLVHRHGIHAPLGQRE